MTQTAQDITTTKVGSSDSKVLFLFSFLNAFFWNLYLNGFLFQNEQISILI
tara:strand:+ start:537 stop:689 length:153 start_codon:yes stop_codon:yes gene_type:complete